MNYNKPYNWLLKKPLVIIWLMIFFAHGLSAQEKTVSRNNQQWVQYYTRIKLNNQWTVLADGGYRWKNELNTKSQYIIRSGLGNDINKNHRVSGGIAHLGFYTLNEVRKMEYRGYQEWMIKGHIGNAKLNHRFRLEERFFNSNLTNLNSFNLRYRYSIMASFKLLSLSKDHPKRILQLKLGNELFVNSGNNTNFFDQNRIIISPTMVWNKRFKVSFTYCSQYASSALENHFVYSDIFWIQIRHKFDSNRKNRKG